MIEDRRGEVTAIMRRRGHLPGGWERTRTAGWATRCARCGHAVVIGANRVFGLMGMLCSPQGGEMAAWRLYNVVRRGLVVSSCRRYAGEVSDPWTVVFSDGSAVLLASDPPAANTAWWSESYNLGEADIEISFGALPDLQQRRGEYRQESTGGGESLIYVIPLFRDSL